MHPGAGVCVEFSPFSLLDIVATETDKFERVRALNIGTRDALKVLAIAPAKDVSYRFDLRSPNLVWLNDMDHDEMYAGWPKSMKTVLFKGGWPGSPRYVAKNMFSAVVVGSLTSDLVDVIMCGLTVTLAEANTHTHTHGPCLHTRSLPTLEHPTRGSHVCSG